QRRRRPVGVRRTPGWPQLDWLRLIGRAAAARGLPREQRLQQSRGAQRDTAVEALRDFTPVLTAWGRRFSVLHALGTRRDTQLMREADYRAHNRRGLPIDQYRGDEP